MVKKDVLLHIVLFLVLIFLPFVQSAENIQIKGFVNDYANIISPDYKSKIEGALTQLYDSKAAEFSIVTIESLEGKDIESYALSLAQGKLGDKEKNNGLLLLVAVKDRKYRFEVGRGLEPILNDARIGRIGRTLLVENFKNEDYGKGIYEASLAVKTTLLDEKDSEYYVNDQDYQVQIGPIILIIFFLIFWIVIISLIVSIKRDRYKKDKQRTDDYFGAALMAAWLFGGRRGGSGGFGGGGFGGFGGGGFGGGGASGGW